MSSRRRDDAPLLSSREQFDLQVEELHNTVKSMRQVSDAIHDELEAHNALLSGLSDRYSAGMEAVGRLLVAMKELYISTGWSPMMMAMVFCAALVLFLWLYWKIKA
jgi:hypothetical protein